MSFENIRCVLLNPSHPGNIGAAARALKTMHLHQLILVNPEEFPSSKATAMASGADDVLMDARIVTDLESAIGTCQTVFGLSSRDRKISWPQLDARQAAEKIWSLSQEQPVAVLFGREQSGLTNEELDRCHYLVQIPANPIYPSLNLAMAVQIMAYEIQMARLQTSQPSSTNEIESVDVKDMERFYEHLETTLSEIEFFNPKNPRKLMRRLRRYFNRSRPNVSEMNILRGILTAAQKKARDNKSL